MAKTDSMVHGGDLARKALDTRGRPGLESKAENHQIGKTVGKKKKTRTRNERLKRSGRSTNKEKIEGTGVTFSWEAK